VLPLLHIGVGGPTWVDWTFHIDAILLVIALEWGYLYAIHDLRPTISDAGRVRRSQQLYFHAGVATLFVAGGSPLHDLGEQYWLSAHMTQHLLLTLVAPPLLIAGIPGWLWAWPLRNRRVFAVAHLLTRPLLAFAIFNAVQLLTHLPPAVDLSLHVGAFHFFVHAMLVVTALLMWWPILSPVPELPRLSYPGQMAYLFLQSLLPSVIVAFITFSDHVVYGFYADAPRLLGLSAITDQQTAGGIMKLGGSLILWSFIGVAFFKWYQHEQAQQVEPSWPEVERELEELGLTRK
jgi:putative membrane protein